MEPNLSNFDIYAIGNALVDTEIDVSNEDLANFKIDKGVMTLVDEARQTDLISQLSGHLVHAKRASGGSAANSIIAASYFGSSTFYSCKVADDENGSFYLNDLESANVAYHGDNGKTEGITGKCLVMITDDAERTMNTFLGVSDSLSKADIDADALKQSRFAYIEGYLVTSETSKEAAITLRELAQQHEVKVTMSLSDPAIAEYFRAGLKEIIGDRVDLIFCNEDEALAFTEKASLEHACEELTKISEHVVVTQGAKGALVLTNGEEIKVQGQEAKAIDTNGAGDMFAGAFLHAMCEGYSMEQAAKFANRSAAKIVEQYGPRLPEEDYRALLPVTQ